MGVPVPEVNNTCIGRYGSASLACRWTSADNDDLTNATIVDIDSDLAGIYDNERMGVEKIEWVCGENVEVVVKFDSLGSDALLLQIPSGSTNGAHTYEDEPNGCRLDPDKDTPGSIIVDSWGALPNDRLWIRLSYKVKGKHKPQGTLS